MVRTAPTRRIDRVRFTEDREKIVRRYEADLSVLWPFTAEEIAAYVAFLRREGAVAVAAAVEAALPQWMGRGSEGQQRRT